MLGLTIFVVFAAIALLAPVFFDESQLDVTKATGEVYENPSGQFWLGTDDSGRNVLALVAWGARISLLVGLCATVLAMVIGTAVGIASGHYRGLVAGVLNRLTDWFLVIPFLPLAIVLATVLGKSLLNIIIVIGVTSWPATARLIRAQTLSVEGRPYLERAKALGRRRPAPDDAPRSAQRHAACAGEHDARRVDLHPVRDDVVLPRPGRSDRGVLGNDPRRRLRQRGNLSGRMVVSG